VGEIRNLPTVTGNGQEVQPESVYGIVVTVTRFTDNSASAEVAIVYGPIGTEDVANLLRVAATKLERETLLSNHQPWCRLVRAAAENLIGRGLLPNLCDCGVQTEPALVR